MRNEIDIGDTSLKGIKFIAQWQATLGASPWVVVERELRPVKGKSPMCQAWRFLLLPLIGRTMRVKPTQGVASLRSPCPGLWTLWAFSPSLTTNYSLLTDTAPQGISVNWLARPSVRAHSWLKKIRVDTRKYVETFLCFPWIPCETPPHPARHYFLLYNKLINSWNTNVWRIVIFTLILGTPIQYFCLKICV